MIMDFKIHQGNCLDILKVLPKQSIDCCVTSPPYWNLRDYENPDQLGLEKTPEEYIHKLSRIFHEVQRVLKDTGTLWLNLGDTYKNKNLVGIPWRTAFLLQQEGWNLRSDIIWHKICAMPESCTDRPTRDHEYVFLFTKSLDYFYDQDSIREEHKWAAKDKRSVYGPTNKSGKTTKGKYAMSHNGAFNKIGKNIRTVWSLTTIPYKDAHFAVFPEKLVEPCIKAGCPENGIVLDPFAGSGTVGVVALKHNRNFIGIELNPEYCKIARKRGKSIQPTLFQSKHTHETEKKNMRIEQDGMKFIISKKK
jgi:site-specific DNA-methyltransferase (adenine-specific)